MAESPGNVRIDGPSPTVSADALSALGAETFVQSFGHFYAASDLATFLKDHHGPDTYQRLLDDPDHAVWVALDGAETAIGYLIAGSCGLPVKDPPPRSGELKRFYILREFQGGGLGGRLLELALTWLHQRFDHVYLGVYSENLKAQRLYERYGFKKIQRYFFMVGDHADLEFIMKRKTQQPD